MRTIITAQAVVCIMLLVLWSTNAYKFCKSDFEAPYTREFVHGLGLVTPAFMVTSFLSIENNTGE